MVILIRVIASIGCVVRVPIPDLVSIREQGARVLVLALLVKDRTQEELDRPCLTDEFVLAFDLREPSSSRKLNAGSIRRTARSSLLLVTSYTPHAIARQATRTVSPNVIATRHDISRPSRTSKLRQRTPLPSFCAHWPRLDQRKPTNLDLNCIATSLAKKSFQSELRIMQRTPTRHTPTSPWRYSLVKTRSTARYRHDRSCILSTLARLELFDHNFGYLGRNTCIAIDRVLEIEGRRCRHHRCERHILTR